jgi:hypothetical protein
MSDSRLNSCHLFFPRRDEYRRAREALLQERGWLTYAAEQFHDLLPQVDDWALDADQAQLDTRYLLCDERSEDCYPLKVGLNTVGRYADNDICFEENVVSRRHCVILVHAWGGCELHDTASRNGTFVNAVRVRQPVALRSGDLIRICDRHLRFLRDGDVRSERSDEEHSGTVVHFPPPG